MASFSVSTIRGTMIKKIVVALMLCGIYAFSFTGLLRIQHHSDENVHIHGIWNLPDPLLLAVAGEFKGLIADYLAMEVGARLGTHVIRSEDGGFTVKEKQYDWQSIYQIFTASLLLDPSFEQTFIVAQGWLPWKPANMIEENQKLQKIAAENRPWDWLPLRNMGFNSYFFLQDRGTAGRLYLEAAQIPNAPPFLRILGARLAQEGGETQTAVGVLKSMLINMQPDDPGYEDLRLRLIALEGVLTIEQAIANYTKRTGITTPTLQQLISSGSLPEIPVNPYMVDFCIDDKGSIFYDRPQCRKQRKYMVD
jgi:hypothetical protein